MKNRWKFLKYIIFSCALSAAAVVSATGCGKFEDIAYEEAEVSSLDISGTKETAPALSLIHILRPRRKGGIIKSLIQWLQRAAKSYL